MRRDSARSAIQRELAYGDTHPIQPQISKTENSRAICHNDDMNVIVGPVPDHLRELATIMLAEVHSPAPSKLMSKLLAHGSHCRRIDQWCNLCNVIHQHTIVQSLVPVVEILQVHVLFNIIITQFLKMHHHSILLLIDGLDSRRQTRGDLACHALTFQRRFPCSRAHHGGCQYLAVLASVAEATHNHLDPLLYLPVAVT